MCLAVPGQLVRIDTPDTATPADSLQHWGMVSFGGILKKVSLAYVPEAIVGDYVLVHVGFALSIVDAEEAEQTLAYFNQLEVVEDPISIVF